MILIMFAVVAVIGGLSNLAQAKNKFDKIGAVIILIIIVVIEIKVYNYINSSTVVQTQKLNDNQIMEDNKAIEDKKIAEDKKITEDNKIINNNFINFENNYSKMTDLQKKEYFESIKGKYVQWTGIVENIDKNIFGSSYICVKCLNTTFTYDYTAYCVNSDDLLNINKNSSITIKGKIDVREGAIIAWGLTDSEIIIE